MGGGKTVVEQPGADVPEYQRSPAEEEMLSLQAETMRELLPRERERRLSMLKFTDPIFGGERLPGQYGTIGGPLGEGVEEELFGRMKERTYGELERLGMLDSGVQSELLSKRGTQLAISDAGRRRGELMQLINLAMGVPLTAGQTAGRDIMGAGAEERAYGLQGAVAEKPVYGYQPGFWEEAAPGIGQGVGTAMMLAMMSSITLKKNVKKISSALEKVNKLQGVTFDWKTSNIEDGGVIAEELEKILPEAVVNIRGIKHVKPMMIIGYLIEAVKELSEKSKEVE